MFAVFTEEGYGWERIGWAGVFDTREEAEEKAGEIFTPGDRLRVFEI
jgi:hypothetical protein